VVLDTLYPAGRDATPIRLDTPEWFAWLAAPEHVAFSYQAHDVSITVRRTDGVWGAWRRSRASGKVGKVYLSRMANLTAARLEAAALRLVDPPPPDPGVFLQSAAGRAAFVAHLDTLAQRLEQQGSLGRKDGRMLVHLARQAFAALGPVLTMDTNQTPAEGGTDV
jgi:hypothetical protein